ncbi:hypothetical protein [Allorhizocola rhizosphaerae]|uniref:hypothetical protein n=1 Tax=Allorhizocola rhizosphaerae TaxID=1872709 RepID=UPI000E3E7BF7|nr:hypothetical protein [Allorhizocola rhizosphaerae]
MRSPLLAVLLCVAALATGCGDAGVPVGTDRLVRDMTRQLERGSQLRYRADYQLAGGNRATVAQQASPSRVAYGYPGGVLIVGEQERTACDLVSKPPRCEVRALAGASPGPPGSGYPEPMKKGLVTGPVVADLLRLVTLQPESTVKPHDTTIAGLPASCLEVYGLVDAPVVNFTACVTADGVLASFSGVINGVIVDQALVKLELRVPDPAELAPPNGANVVDLRQP